MKKKNQINELSDKDLQLQYFLGGLKLIKHKDQPCNYWSCDINCSCDKVPDDERLTEVKKFIKKHNITNERFLKLSYWYLIGAIMRYKNEYSPLFIELDSVLKPYDFIYSKYGEIPDNNFREKELEDMVDEPIVKEYCEKYKLDKRDFITLAKTSLNFRLYKVYVGINPNDTFLDELYNIVNDHNLYVSREQIEEYRKMSRNKQEVAILATDTKTIQKKYLQLMQELIKKDPNLAIEMISKELNELGFNTKKDIKRLIIKNDSSEKR